MRNNATKVGETLPKLSSVSGTKVEEDQTEVSIKSEKMMTRSPHKDKPTLNLTSFCFKSMYKPRMKRKGRRIQNPMNPNGLTMMVVRKEKTVFCEKITMRESSDMPIPNIDTKVALSIPFFICEFIIRDFINKLNTKYKFKRNNSLIIRFP